MSQNGLRISVALCTYNGARHLREQLDSIAAQTHLPHEIVICDDRSQDDTSQIVEDFARAAPFPIRFSINEKNLGSTRNFGRAISLCEGEIIALCDQDDVWLPHKLERMAQRFAASPRLGLIFSDAEVVDENLHPLGERLWDVTFTPHDRRAVKRGNAFDVLVRYNVVTGATAAFRARFKNDILPMPSNSLLLHDGWIALIISTLAPVAFIDEALILYRQHAGQQLGVAASLEAAGRWPEPRNRAEVLEHVALNCAFWRNDICASHTLFLNRLADRPDSKHLRTAIAQAEQKISYLDGRAAHYRARARIARQGSRADRLQLIARESLGRRYNRYSNGVRGTLADLLQLRF